MAEANVEAKYLHDLAIQAGKETEKIIPEDVGVIIITFHRRPDTQLGIASTVIPELTMEIIDHCAHSKVALVSVDGQNVTQQLNPEHKQ